MQIDTDAVDDNVLLVELGSDHPMDNEFLVIGTGTDNMNPTIKCSCVAARYRRLKTLLSSPLGSELAQGQRGAAALAATSNALPHGPLLPHQAELGAGRGGRGVCNPVVMPLHLALCHRFVPTLHSTCLSTSIPIARS